MGRTKGGKNRYWSKEEKLKKEDLKESVTIYDFAKNLECDFISLIAENDNYESLGYYKEVGYVKLINKEK